MSAWIERHLLPVAVCAILGCSSTTEPPVGDEGQPCYPNGTCNSGLTCASNLCVRVPDAKAPDAKAPDLRLPDGSSPETAPQDGARVEGGTTDANPDAGPCKTNTDCDDGLTCTTDMCGVGGCTYVINGNFCVIGQACVTSGTVNPANACQKCLPLVAQSAWSNDDGIVCDDGVACTHTDTCTGGSCAGTAYTCDDGLACTIDTCNGTAGPPAGCDYAVASGRCLIGGNCYTDGASQTSTCLRCDSTTSTSSWTAFPASGCVTTLAGSPPQGFADGPAGSAKFAVPPAVAVAATGKVFLADTENHRIRLFANGQVSTFAGSTKGFADGPVASAKFDSPSGIAVDATGNVYVADHGNTRVRLISAGQVSTLAGTTQGLADGPASAAKFSGSSALPWDGLAAVAVDAAGKVFVADAGNSRIRLIAGGQVSTFAGSTEGFTDGPAAFAKFARPTGVAVDGGGNVYVADSFNMRIRLISAGQVSTLAGSTEGYLDGPTASAQFGFLKSIDVSSGGDIYVSSYSRIRLISGGQVSTVAGGGPGYVDGPLALAKFSLWGIAVNAAGKIFVADYTNSCIRLVTP